MNSKSLPDLRLLFLFAVGLPALVVAIDHMTWMRQTWGVQFIDRRTLFLTWLVIKCALLSWTAGRFFASTPWGWGVFVWSMALVSIQTYGSAHGFSREYAYTLVAAQIGLLTVWFILGATSIAWRLTALFLGTAAIVYLAQCIAFWGSPQWSTYREQDLMMFFVQGLAAGALVLVAGVLRLTGFKLRTVKTSDAATSERQIRQFGVKHMLLWMTALAPLLLVTKGMDVVALSRFTTFEIYPATLIGGCIVLVNLTTIWFALGVDLAIARSVAFAGVTIGSGFYLQLESADWQATYGSWPSLALLRMAIRLGEDQKWVVWFLLTAGLLAAMLTFLRACGYRLAKVVSQA